MRTPTTRSPLPGNGSCHDLSISLPTRRTNMVRSSCAYLMLVLCLCRNANASEISISISVRWSTNHRSLWPIPPRETIPKQKAGKLVSRNFVNTAPAYVHMLMFWCSHLLLNFLCLCLCASENQPWIIQFESCVAIVPFSFVLSPSH